MSVSISVSMSGDGEARLRGLAREAGVAPEDLAARLLERTVRRLADLEGISGPIAERFRASGMTEDELSGLLEREKHAMRAERGGRRKAS